MSKRPVVATLLRQNRPVRTRHYLRLYTALRRQTEIAFLEGEPRDVIEFSHAVTGAQIGTMRVGVGSLKTNWIWEEVVKLGERN